MEETKDNVSWDLAALNKSLVLRPSPIIRLQTSDLIPIAVTLSIPVQRPRGTFELMLLCDIPVLEQCSPDKVVAGVKMKDGLRDKVEEFCESSHYHFVLHSTSICDVFN